MGIVRMYVRKASKDCTTEKPLDAPKLLSSKPRSANPFIVAIVRVVIAGGPLARLCQPIEVKCAAGEGQLGLYHVTDCM